MKKIFVVLMIALTTLYAAFAQDNEKKNGGWSFSVVTDAAYYFKSAPVTGGDHFAQMTGPYDGIELRSTFYADYKIPTPLGSHFLLESANVKLGASFELSPISVMPGISAAFEPVPFLVFSTGAKAATGWPLPFMGLQGLGILNEKLEFDDVVPFRDWRIEYWAKGLFQFDTGAIWKGDWTHIVMQASIMFSYLYVTTSNIPDIWVWQNTINYANGWQYKAEFVLGYQMPIVMDMVGLLVDITGQMNASDFGDFADTYNGSFAEINFSPAVRFKLGKKDFLFVVGRFKSRRSFEQEYSSKYEMLGLDYAGCEWFFDRIALSWTHQF